MKVSFIKKISLYFQYRRNLKIFESELQERFNARVDNINRIYTVLNIPENMIEEPYNIRKSDIDALSQTLIKDYSGELGKFLNSKGLTELYKFYDIKKVDKLSYLLIFGFSLFNTKNAFISIIISSMVLSIIGILSYILYNNF